MVRGPRVINMKRSEDVDYLKLFKELGASVKWFDPRPDLSEDSPLWSEVLGEAEGDKNLFGLLHGLRCGGGRLEVRENGSLKLNYETLLKTWNRSTLLSRWLEPNKKEVATAFKAVAERMNSDVGN